MVACFYAYMALCNFPVAFKASYLHTLFISISKQDFSFEAIFADISPPPVADKSL